MYTQCARPRTSGEMMPKMPIAISSQPYSTAGFCERSATRPKAQAPRPRPPIYAATTVVTDWMVEPND